MSLPLSAPERLELTSSLTAGASVSLETNLKKASGTASQREYEAALNGVSAAVAAIVGDEAVALPQSIEALEPALDVALVLLRDGPEGEMACIARREERS